MTSATDTVDALVLDLLEWIGPSGRAYDEVMDAWRTSCPRLPVWEEARARGFVVRHDAPGQGRVVSVSSSGREHLARQRQGRSSHGTATTRARDVAPLGS